MESMLNIGLCFPRYFKFYAHEVVEGMIQVAADHPYLHFKDLRFTDIKGMAGRIRSTDLDGLILGLNGGEYRRIKKAVPESIPVINVHPDVLSESIPTVRIDYAALAMQVVEYLGGLGYHHLVCLSTIETQSAKELSDMIESRAEERGLSSSRFLIELSLEFYETGIMASVPQFDSWLKELDKPAAVITTGGYTALFLEQTALRLGFSVPGDFSVLSISDDDICLFAEPPITSIRSAGVEIGRQALGIIDAALHGVSKPVGVQNVSPPSIIERRSTGFPTGMEAGAKLALRFIREHACEGLTVDEVVRHIRIMGRTKLYYQFKRYIGRSPAAEILRMRLEHACKELVSTNIPITRISENCGFNSHAQFSSSFRREIGMTAMEYRKRHSQ